MPGTYANQKRGGMVPCFKVSLKWYGNKHEMQPWQVYLLDRHVRFR